MAKSIGLSRNIKKQWLDKAAELYCDNLSENEYKNKMNEYLSFEIESPTNLRKTREILMNLWYYDNDDDITRVRKEAGVIINKNKDMSVAIHWGMLLSVYPVFADLCKFIGRFSELSDTVVLSQLKGKLYDEWGERSTLFHSTDKIIATMKDLGVIYAEKPGKYKVIKCKISKEEISLFLIKIAMKATGRSYYTQSEVSNFGVLFPFEYKISKEDFYNNNDYLISNFGGNETFSLKNIAV